MKVGDLAPTPCPVDRLVDELGQMCDEAAQVVTTIVIEFPMPFRHGRQRRHGGAVVEQSVRDGVGGCRTLWHLVRLTPGQAADRASATAVQQLGRPAARQ